MKLQVNASDVERGGITHENEFTIKTTAKAFDILSSGLYSDKILAIVRELSCNAYDAHVAAGTEDTPFIIHLPNSLEPFFSVKDFGTGLSDEDIRGELVPVLIKNEAGESVQAVDAEGKPEFKRVGGLYTTYFDSTKTDSNDFIGALGLGSKSPFSYTRAFEVISRHNGTIRTYAIFINEHGVPTVAMMSECDTLEKNGLEVKLTIKNSDCYAFSKKTAEALRYFPHKPTVVGDPYFEFKELPEASLRSQDPNNDWFLTRKSYETPTIVQGNVAYPLDRELVRDVLSEDEQSFVLNATAVLFFNVGEIEVAASREAIQYDPRTKQNIKKKISTVLKDLSKIIKERVESSADSYWKTAAELNEISKALFGSARTISHFLDDLTDSGKNKHVKAYVENGGVVKLSHLLFHKMYDYKPNTWSANRNYRRDSLPDYISPEKDIIIVIDDLPLGGPSRIGEALARNPDKQFISLSPERSKDKLSWLQNRHQVKDIDAAIAAEQANWIKELCNPPLIIKTSDLPPKKRQSSPKNRSDKFYTWEAARRYPYNGRWRLTTNTNMETGGFYVVMYRTNSLVDHIGQAHKIESKLYETLRSIATFHTGDRQLKDISTNIVGVRPSVAKKLKKSKKWFNVFDVATKKAAELTEMRDIKKQLDEEKQKHSTAINSNAFDFLFNKKVRTLLENRGAKIHKKMVPIYKTCDELAKYYNLIGSLEVLNAFTSSATSTKKKTQKKSRVVISEVSDHVYKTYPMLRVLDSRSALLWPETVVSYILNIERPSGV